MGKGLDRQRGEGNTEYVVLLTFVLICAVVGLFTSYSGAIKKVQLEKGLCIDCTDRDSGKYGTAKGTTSTSGTSGTSDGKEKPNDDLSNNRSTSNTAGNATVASASSGSWWDSLRDLLGWWIG